jgi:hypothetical protein
LKSRCIFLIYLLGVFLRFKWRKHFPVSKFATHLSASLRIRAFLDRFLPASLIFLSLYPN